MNFIRYCHDLLSKKEKKKTFLLYNICFLVICPKENLKAAAKNSYFITRMFCVVYLLLYAVVVIF